MKRTARPYATLPVALCLALMTTGCDVAEYAQPHEQETLRTVTIHGVRHVAEGTTLLKPSPSGALTVADHGGSGGVFVDTRDYRRGDFIFKPVTVAQGGTFIADVTDAHTEPLVRVLHEGLTTTQQRLQADFNGLGASALTLEFRNQGTLVHRLSHVTANSQTGLFDIGLVSAGPTSFHYEVVEINGEKVIVVTVDYENAAMHGTDTARIQPAFAERQDLVVTHVTMIPEAASRPAPRIGGVRLAGSRRGDITLVHERFE